LEFHVLAGLKRGKLRLTGEVGRTSVLARL
jgi:hypothetical protein